MSTLTKVICISLAVYAGNSQAAMITENGSTVSFTYDDSLLDLFGSPVISGDNFFFTPTNFKATSINTGALGFDNTASTTKVTITSLAGNSNKISFVNLTERGNYNQLNVLANPSTAQASVAGQIRALDIASQNEVTDFIHTSAFTQTAANFQTTNWTGTASVNVGSLNTSSIVLTIENLLFAVSPSLGDYAFVEKNFAGLSVVTTSPVPLPAAAWMFGAALFGFLSLSKRQNRL